MPQMLYRVTLYYLEPSLSFSTEAIPLSTSTLEKHNERTRRSRLSATSRLSLNADVRRENMKYSIILIIIGSMFLTSCATDSRYAFLNHDTLESDEYDRAVAAVPFDEIQMGRTTCYGTCPAYTVTFRRNGEALYTGEAYVEKVGPFKGEINIWDYGRLCKLIENSRLHSFDDNYDDDRTDSPSTFIRVKDSRTNMDKSTAGYEDMMPDAAWTISRVIDGIAASIDWKPADPKQ